MSEADLRDAMAEIADRAPVPPADLLDRVEAGHRRQRRRTALTAAFCAVLVVAGGGWVISRPPTERDLPVSFQLPPIPANPPLITETWPAATVTGPLPPPPDDTIAVAMARIDQKHLLVWGRVPRLSTSGSSTLWNYSVDERTYRPVVTDLPERALLAMLSIADGQLARVEQIDIVSRIYLSPITGGPEREIPWSEKVDVTGVFAAGGSVYWSMNPQASRIMRYRPDTRRVERMAGFDGMSIDGTEWARDASGSLFRNVITGEERVVHRPAGVTKLQCVPAFCLGNASAGWFLQRLDGTERTTLPYPGKPTLIGEFGRTATEPRDSGMLLLENGVLIDPIRGKLGIATRRAQCSAVSTPRGPDLVYGWSESIKGRCGSTFSTAYIGGSD